VRQPAVSLLRARRAGSRFVAARGVPRDPGAHRRAFGGKEDFPSLLAIHTACWPRSRRARQIVYDRREDLAVTTKRHPSVSSIAPARPRRRLLAMEIDVRLDGGRT